ncbi:probable protein disulfide-isomerase ER-60 [Ctenocephalides felis]|uniref:probable protein disulfide-isomerase ER-60 n=1 Tax=Ctenocephalides felis TaxID=7515 RepID=UPI000E6E5959|nr:probable protein disulfide-isomerase ER-60 [Ctenocephalides felis]
MNYLAPSSKNNSFNISKFGGQLLNNCDLFEKSDCRSIKIKKSKPVFKFQRIPELNSGSVKEAEANNFDELVYKNHKDTLVVFYAFWCRRCKMLAPIYEEVGKMMKNEDVDIVKIDATSIDIPKKFKVYFYPTLYWLPKLYKENHIRYKAGINTIDLVKFIAENSTKELKGYDRLGNSKHIKHSDTKKN